jgi:2-octaprenyl-6-methoxyphenol hydroxylase
MNAYDIIIIGGGMVGASLAAALRDAPFTIALVDAAPVQNTDDPRLIALNDSSCCLFQHLGIWDALLPHAAAIKQVHVSDRGHFGITRLNANDVKLDALGYVVPAKYINAALDDVLQQEQSNLKIFRPAELITLTQQDDQVTVQLTTTSGACTLTGKLVIGADGTHSTVRAELGIDSDITEYEQSALVTITTLNRPHQGVAYERFHPGGALAMLPLTGQRAATIWTDDKNVIADLLNASDADFLATLQQQFGYRLGRLLATGQRHFYPLRMIKSTQLLKQRVLLIGNAAHTLHPIAAQGLNLALAEIAMLVQVLMDTPTLSDWQPFLRWQQQQIAASARLSHQLPQLFGSAFSLLTLVRQIGMLGLDLTPPLKRRFTWRALGHTNDTPRLLLKKNS